MQNSKENPYFDLILNVRMKPTGNSKNLVPSPLLRQCRARLARPTRCRKDLKYPEPLSFSIGCLWLAGNKGMEKEMETIIMGSIRPTIRIHSFIPNSPKP